MRKTYFLLIILYLSSSILLYTIETSGPQEQLLLSFSINNAVCEIQNVKNKFTIIVKFPYEINLENLIAEFETKAETLVFINEIQQESGLTVNDFSKPITYILRNKDDIVQKYKVKIVFGTEFKMNFGAGFQPSYSLSYKMINLGVAGNLFMGAKLNRFIIGGEVSNIFFIFNGQYNYNNLSGYWNILNGAIVNHYIFNKYFELKWGIGGSWIYSEFDYDNFVLFTRNNPGIFTEFDLRILIWKYIRLDIINQFELFINIKNGNPFTSIENFYPHYNGGVRLNFLNFIKWFGFYFEASGLYSYYKNNNIDTTTAMFIFNTGVFFDFQFPSLIKNSSKNGNNKKIGKKTGIGIEALKKAKVNEMVDFPDIKFKKDSDELTEQAYKDLSDISDLLKERNSMEISIKLFTNKGEDPVNLLAEGLKKTKIIKDYLIKQGVEEKRIYLPSEISLFPDEKIARPNLVRILVIKK